jgi:hypothetical protein
MPLTAQDIEIAVAQHFNPRLNLIVPNVSWGWGLCHEADLIVLRPSGYCDEVEIKVTASDIKADLKKPNNHWESRRIARVWFAVPWTLADSPDIPARAGVLSVMRGRQAPNSDGQWVWQPWQPGDLAWVDSVTVKRAARLRDRETRRTVTPEQRLKLAELGSIRIWDLKAALARRRQWYDKASQGSEGKGGQA